MPAKEGAYPSIKEKAMYVYCINNRGLEKYLTLEKKYEVFDRYGNDAEFGQYTIINDKGTQNPYSRSRFADTEKWRDYQLRKII